MGIVYSSKRVGELLGIETPDVPAPEPIDGFDIVWVPDIIAKDLANLHSTQTPLGRHRICTGRYTSWSEYWAVKVPYPNTGDLDFSDQAYVVEERTGLVRTPVNVLATLWAVHKLATGEDIFQGKWIRCPESRDDNFSFVVLDGDSDILLVGSDECILGPDERVWASGAVAIPSKEPCA